MSATPCPRDPGQLLALAAGHLSAEEARQVRAHVQTCTWCQSALDDAEEVARGAAALRGPHCDDETRERSWQAVATQADAAASQMQRRIALSVLLQNRAVVAVGLGAVAATVVVVTVLAFRSDETPPAPAALVPAPEASTPLTPSPVPPASVEGDEPPWDAAPRQRIVQELRQPPGTRLLRCGARARLAEAVAQVVHDQHDHAVVALERGEVHLDVPKLEDGEVAVVTPDARVVVTGTQFSVARWDEDFTEVVVVEGMVRVEPVGRAGEELTLHAGEQATIPSLEVFLNDLIGELDAAIDRGALDTGEQLARRYLRSAMDPRARARARLRLAGILSNLGRPEEALKLYRAVADGPGDDSSRENALAMVAMLHTDAGRREAAASIWQELVQRFPDGLHTREALTRLVASTCGKDTPDAASFRWQLAVRAGSSEEVVELLQRCEVASE